MSRYPKRERRKPPQFSSTTTRNLKKRSSEPRRRVSRDRTFDDSQKYSISLTYTAERGRQITIEKTSVETLNEKEYVDDVVVEAHMQMVFDSLCQTSMFGFVSPHFLYASLSEEAGGPGNATAREASDFSKPVTFVPVNDGPADDHWSVAMVLQKNRKFGAAGKTSVIHIDSLSAKGRGHDPDEVLRPLVDHLNVVDPARPATLYTGRIDSPQQPNKYDCALYMFKTIECIIREVEETGTVDGLAERIADVVDFEHKDARDLRGRIHAALVAGAS